MHPRLIILIAFFLTIPLSGMTQITFVKGYFIDSNNQRVECLIQDADWKNNPDKFRYKLTETSDVQEGNLDRCKEFGVGNDLKYARHKVKYDMTSATKYDYDRNPKWEERTLFLQVLVEGKATLFKHREEGFERYFFSKDGALPEQLVYKYFLARSTPTMTRATNNYYLAQLKVNVNCNPTEVINIPYEEAALVKQFQSYNECSGGVAEKRYERKRKIETQWRALAGADFSQMTMIHPTGTSEHNIDFGSTIGLRLGIQAEFVLPFNKKKWSVPVEIAYRSYSGSDTYGFSNQEELTIDYTSIEMLTGVRYYMFLNSSSKLFLTAAVVYDSPLNATIKTKGSFQYDIASSVNQSLSFGFSQKKLSVELRYYTMRNPLRKYSLISNDFKNISFVIGYRFR